MGKKRYMIKVIAWIYMMNSWAVYCSRQDAFKCSGSKSWSDSSIFNKFKFCNWINLMLLVRCLYIYSPSIGWYFKWGVFISHFEVVNCFFKESLNYRIGTNLKENSDNSWFGDSSYSRFYSGFSLHIYSVHAVVMDFTSN